MWITPTLILSFATGAKELPEAAFGLLLDNSSVSPVPEHAARAKTMARASNRARAFVNFFICPFLQKIIMLQRGRRIPAPFLTILRGERDRAVLHGFHDRQRFKMDTHAADQLSAGLKALFNHDSNAFQLCAGLIENVL